MRGTDAIVHLRGTHMVWVTKAVTRAITMYMCRVQIL